MNGGLGYRPGIFFRNLLLFSIASVNNSMHFCYCTHGCVCQRVIKENDDDDESVQFQFDDEFAVLQFPISFEFLRKKIIISDGLSGCSICNGS